MPVNDNYYQNPFGINPSTGQRYLDENPYTADPKSAPKLGDDDYDPNADPNSAYNVSKGMFPDYISALDDSTGLLKNQYQLQSTYDPKYGQALGEFALSKGPSQQAQYLQGLQKLGQQNALQTATQQGRGALSSSYSDLAQRGGLSAGARERLTSQNSRNVSQGLQGIRNQGLQDMLGISAADEGAKLAALPTAQNLEGQRSAQDIGVKQFNIGGALNQLGGKNAANLAKYEEMMKAKAADQQAQATANQGKTGLFG